MRVMKPKDLTFLDGVSEIDWARLAMCLDGEGCICIKSVHGNRSWSRRVLYVDVIVVSVDPRMTQWLQQTFGGSVNARKRQHARQAPCTTWNVASRHAAALLRRCLPYFICKRDQAEIALAFQDTILTKCPYGCKGRPPELIAQQYQLRESLAALHGNQGKGLGYLHREKRES